MVAVAEYGRAKQEPEWSEERNERSGTRNCGVARYASRKEHQESALYPKERVTKKTENKRKRVVCESRIPRLPQPPHMPHVPNGDCERDRSPQGGNKAERSGAECHASGAKYDSPTRRGSPIFTDCSRNYHGNINEVS